MEQILNMSGKGIERAMGEVVGSLQYFKLHGYQTVKWRRQETIPKKNIYHQTKIAPQPRLIWSCAGATPSIYSTIRIKCYATFSAALRVK